MTGGLSQIIHHVKDCGFPVNKVAEIVHFWLDFTFLTCLET